MRFGSPHFRVEELGPGAHAAIARDGGFGLSNSGIIDLGGRSVVFDSMLTPMAGVLLRRAAEKLTGQRPSIVINSHWHGDHVRGNPMFAPAHVLSSRRTRELILRRSQQELRDDRGSARAELVALARGTSPIPARDHALYRGWFTGLLRTPSGAGICPPDLTFDSAITIEGSRRSLRVVTYGGGHSPSDVFAYLPDERTGFLGDLLTHRYHPYVGDGHIGRWISILRRVQRLGLRRFVPGHGPVGTTRSLASHLEYLEGLRSAAGAAMRDGTPRAELERTPIPRRYATWNFSTFYGPNLGHAFRELNRAGPS